MAECIDARITADILNDLANIRTENGYNTNIGTVEEKRTVLQINTDNDTFAILERLSPDFEDDFQHTQDSVLRFMIYFFNGEDDTAIGADPIQYTDRNVHADIQYALMRDRTRGGLAQNTIVKSHGHDFFFQQGVIDVPIMCTWVLIEVERLIDADNPYELA